MIKIIFLFITYSFKFNLMCLFSAMDEQILSLSKIKQQQKKIHKLKTN